jgi:membrane-bound lytic murein transglycosylase A
LDARSAHPARRALTALAVALGALLLAPDGGRAQPYRLAPASFADLPGFNEDRLDEALRTFARTCDKPARSELQVEGLDRNAFARICAAASRGEGAADPRAFFTRHFRPFRIVADAAGDAFFTGYYQPEMPGSLTRSAAFPTPVYALPSDVVVLSRAQKAGALEALSAARKTPGGLEPYPDRGAIEDGVLAHAPGVRTLVYLRDNVDLFLAQVQGSARVRLADGRVLRLSFAGRNGQPYTALARVLVQRGVATPAEMTMRRLTDWIRRNGLEKGQPGDDLLRLNRSYVFFEAHFDANPNQQPQGGAGAALTPFRSIAIDSHIWPYGLPFFIDVDAPWRSAGLEPFRRVVIAQDTGSAIVGPARADIFFGLGDAVGERASEIRHHGQFYLLLPIP